VSRGGWGFLLRRRSFGATPGVGRGAPLDEAGSQPVPGFGNRSLWHHAYLFLVKVVSNKGSCNRSSNITVERSLPEAG